MPVHLSLVRWDARDEVGGMNFFATPEDPSFDITQWITLGKNDFILEAGESEVVPLTISVPPNAEPGGKYGAIFVSPVFPEFYFAEGSPRVMPEIGVLVLLDVPLVGLEGQRVAPSVSVEEFAIEGRSAVFSEVASRLASMFRAPLQAFAAEPPVSVDVLTKTPSSFLLRVRNNGITHVRPSGTVTVHNLVGHEVARATLPPTTILPGKIRQLPITFEQTNRRFLPQIIEHQLALGRYTATVVLEGIGGEPLVATLAYWVFPWRGLLGLLLVFVPLGFGIFRFRSRLRDVARILFRG
jgi:hypothetical protein